MQIALVPMADLERMAVAVAHSGMFAVKTKEQAFSLMLLAQADGIHPMLALRRYHVMHDGRTSMRADAMLADFRKLGGRVKWLTNPGDPTEQVGEWSLDGNTTKIGYTFKEAQDAGYVRPNSGWFKDRAAMLRARAISRAVRMLAPEVVAGMYTPEEMEDIPAPVAPAGQPANWKPVPTIGRAEMPAATDAETKPVPLNELIKGEDVGYALAYLIHLGWLKESEGFGDLKPPHASRIGKNPPAFLAAAREWYNKALPQEGPAQPPLSAAEAARRAVKEVFGGDA